MNEYLKQATDFLQKTGTELLVRFLKHDKHFEDDKETRDIYEVTLKRGNRKYTFNFGQSLNASKEFMLNAGNKPTFATQKELLKYCMDKAYPTRYAGKNPNFAAPNAYDILACVQKYEVGTFENFCGDFGYDTDSRKALKTYNAVNDEYKSLAALFTESELELMAEIS